MNKLSGLLLKTAVKPHSKILSYRLFLCVQPDGTNLFIVRVELQKIVTIFDVR